MPLHEISAADLVERAVRNARPRGPRAMPRWACIKEAFGLGRTYSADLCWQHGLDPDESIPGTLCEECKP
jgi:hypothetical protein